MYEVSEELWNGIVAYLASRPYAEVYVLINGLQQVANTKALIEASLGDSSEGSADLMEELGEGETVEDPPTLEVVPD